MVTETIRIYSLFISCGITFRGMQKVYYIAFYISIAEKFCPLNGIVDKLSSLAGKEFIRGLQFLIECFEWRTNRMQVIKPQYDGIKKFPMLRFQRKIYNLRIPSSGLTKNNVYQINLVYLFHFSNIMDKLLLL